MYYILYIIIIISLLPVTVLTRKLFNRFLYKYSNTFGNRALFIA